MVKTSGCDNGGNGLQKKKWRLTKEDFLPEESFQNWGNYVAALSNIRARLMDRLLSRSLDEVELHQVRARSQHEMKKTLNWWDIIWFGVGSVMGSGIFVLTGEAMRNYAGPAVVISYVISGVSALLSVLCYTEFTVELPISGGSFAYLRVELGDFIAYIAAGNILFEYIVGGASVARSWTSYFASLCNHDPDSFRIHVPSFAEEYSYLDPIAVGISILICIGASASIKGSSRFNSLTSISHVVVLLFILIAGLTKANPKNFVEHFAPNGIRGMLKASSILFFAYVGFDGVATLGEEIKNPGRDIPIGLIGSMGIIIGFYTSLSTTLALMQPYIQVDTNAPFTMAFKAVGMDWTKYVVAFGALEGMTAVLLANIIGQGRYFTHIGRTHMAPPFLAAINEKTGTPMNATILMTILNSIVAFFTSLEVLANLLSIATLFLFSLVALALMVRRYYVTGLTTDSDRNRLFAFLTLIVGSSMGSAAFWAVSSGWIAYTITVPVWFLSTLGLQLMVKEARKPKLWGVPLNPWLPSACIAINLFVMGSIDRASFQRFGIWTFLLLMYYLFIAMHASYDAAKEIEREANKSAQATLEAGKS